MAFSDDRKTEARTITYEELKSFIETQIKTLKSPLSTSKQLHNLVGEELTDRDLKHLLTEVNKLVIKRYNRFFNNQSKLQIIEQVINNETRLNLAKKENLLKLNELITRFENGKIVDLNGGYTTNTSNHRTTPFNDDDDDDDEIRNINLNGLVSLKKSEILSIINELPSSNDLNTNNVELIDDYDQCIDSLRTNKRRLIHLTSKLEYYRNLRTTLQRFVGDTANDGGYNGQNELDLQKNLVLGSNDALVNEVSRTRILMAVIMDKLKDERNVQILRESLQDNLNHI